MGDIMHSVKAFCESSTFANNDNSDKVKKIMLKNRRDTFGKIAESLNISYLMTYHNFVDALSTKIITDRLEAKHLKNVLQLER